MENSLGVQESQGESVSGEDLYDWCQELHAPWSQNAETGCKGQPYKRVKPRPHHQAVTASLLSEPTGTGCPQMGTPQHPRFIHHSTEHRACGSDWFLQPPSLTSAGLLFLSPGSYLALQNRASLSLVSLACLAVSRAVGDQGTEGPGGHNQQRHAPGRLRLTHGS